MSSRRRRILFRLAAVALALAPFLLLEGIFCLLGIGQPRYDHDPFVGFRAVHPLFVLSEDGQRYQIAPSRLGFFRPDSFAAKKPDDEFRVFCLGGSTVQGRPFAIESSFPTFLELSLEAADPSRRWEVVNCGGVSYASYRLVPILEEVLGYQPDLIVLYTGHNEFLEERTYGHIKHMPEIVARPVEILAGTRTYRVIREAILPRTSADASGADAPVLADEVQAMLEYRGGLDHYHRDEKLRRDAIDHFEYNLRRMVALAQRAGVPMVLANPVCNLRDCPPFKNQHRDGLTVAQLERWKQLVDDAASHQGKNPARTAELLEEAVKIDNQHAGVRFLLAKTCDAMGESAKARREYLQAKDLDVCPLRILEPMNQAVLRVAEETGTPLVDVRKMYEEISPAGIPGNLYMVDHVHPSIEGHQLVADLLASRLSLMGLVDPQPGWRERRNAAYQKQLDSLDDLYYSKGLQRLEMLRCWVQGKAGANWSIEGDPPPTAEESTEPARSAEGPVESGPGQPVGG